MKTPTRSFEQAPKIKRPPHARRRVAVGAPVAAAGPHPKEPLKGKPALAATFGDSPR